MKTQPTTSWIQYWRPKLQARVRLFCFPYAGRGASLFRTWSEKLPPEIEVYPVQLPGREQRLAELPFNELHGLIDALITELHPYLDIPYAFFGHSMGALISFEFARAIRRSRYALPLHLFVSGYQAPQLPDPSPPIHSLPESSFLEAVRSLKGVPEKVLQDSDLMRLYIPLLRADFALCESYSYTDEPPFSCPISAFGGQQDAELTGEMMNAWCEQTSASCKVHFFAGDHFFIHQIEASLFHVLIQELFADLEALR